MPSRSILSGIKTAAVINVGTATIGALIGAGGYGEPILAGLRLYDVPLILQGAIPAALMAADGEAGAFCQQVGPALGHLAQRRGGFLLLGPGQRPAAGEAARHAGDLS